MAELSSEDTDDSGKMPSEEGCSACGGDSEDECSDFNEKGSKLGETKNPISVFVHAGYQIFKLSTSPATLPI